MRNPAYSCVRCAVVLLTIMIATVLLLPKSSAQRAIRSSNADSFTLESQRPFQSNHRPRTAAGKGGRAVRGTGNTRRYSSLPGPREHVESQRRGRRVLRPDLRHEPLK